MKKIIFLILLTISFKITIAQTGDSPYPIIFVHGLNSDDHTWSTTLTQLSAAWNLSTSHTLSAVINARGGDTTNYVQDILIPLKDATGTNVNNITPSSIYAVNLGNFWNRNAADPRIILYNNTTPGSNQSPSNQSAIYKQAFVLKALIDSVLRVTGAEKVILVGHSMGGLAIREYLQRRENGVHKWWIDPADSINGHKVAKVVTIGTPHLGTNVGTIPFLSIDFKSEAMRDMRISYSSSVSAPYLFSNTESSVPLASYYNADINCNGLVTDTISGISAGDSDNPLAPLPVNILYTWILSNYLGLGTDGAVNVSKQALFSDTAFVFVPAGVTDTLMTNKNHIQETGDVRTLIRGLDEPDTKQFAYKISFNKLYSGFITLQSKSVTSDSDYYKVQSLTGGKITVVLKSLNSGVTNFSLLNDSGTILSAKNVTAPTDSISFSNIAGTYFVRIAGNSTLNPTQTSYGFTVKNIPSATLNLTLGIEGLWNGTSQVADTIKAYLTSNLPPFNNVDSAVSVLNASGNSQLNFIHAQSGNYYIRVTHRNALETWSSSPLIFSNGAVTDYDFSDSQSKAFGNNQLFKSGKWCIFSGDVDRDDGINLTDILAVYNDAKNFVSGYVHTDLTGDELTDLSDLVITFNNSGNFVSVIRP